MSDFDSNPFADPAAANPFSDPAVQQAANTQRTRSAGLDEFNPFADGNSSRPTMATQPAPPPPTRPTPTQPQPAVMMPSEAPPPYTPSGGQRIDTEDLKRQQEELERRADELQRKEQQLRDSQAGVTRTNNWPPLPSKCPIGPCFYQDFAVDIPLEFQRIVKSLYYLWMFYGCVLLLNVLGSLAYFIADSKNSSSGATFGLSILFLVLFTPCSFICWYRPVYKAFKSDSSFNFFVFFFIFFFQFCVAVIQALGIDSLGTCGWINGFRVVGAVSVAVGIIMLVCGSLFTLVSCASVFFLIKVHRIYRSTGASFDKAKAEFSQGVMKNEHVQTGVAGAAGAAARGAMSGNADYRY